MLDAAPVLPEGVDLDGVRSWEVRLLCPSRGHFCLNLAVIEVHDDLVLACPVDGLTKPEFISEFSEIVNAARLRPRRGTSGWIRQSGHRIGVYSRAELTVECANKKCSYSGTFEYFALADELRSAAASGHAEYRLTQ